MDSPASARQPVPEDFEWEVFLSYRKPDFESVAAIASKLRERRIKVWWDEWNVRPGSDFQEALWDGLRRSWSAAVFIGPRTVGGWQEQEVKSAIDLQVKNKKPVIPVFLPDSGDPDQVDMKFLGLNSRIVFTSLNDQQAMNRLIWGITGVNPELNPPPYPIEPPPAPLDDSAIDFLGPRLMRSGNVTFLIGGAVSRIDPALPPRDCEIARKLLQQLKWVGTDDVKFLPPLDFAATFYGLGQTDPVLEETVVALIQARSTRTPATHEKLAELLLKLRRREKPRGRRPEKQLLITTNIDLMMERALLQAGIGFTRVVQHKSERLLHVTNYQSLGLIPADVNQIDDLIANGDTRRLQPEMVTGSVLEEPILYKTRGSQDITGSCALTRPQLLTLARSMIVDKLVPDELQKIAANTPIVALGTSVLDPDFQYMAHTVLFDAWESDHPKYIVQVAPSQDSGDVYRQMEAGIWEQVKRSAMRRNLATVEEGSDRFLSRLIASLKTP